MFAIKTESIKSYVETPKSLLKEHHSLIALIADNGNHFLAYGIVEGTTLYIDLDAEYEENTLSCFINKQWQFKLFICELEGYDYVGRIVAAYKSYEV